MEFLHGESGSIPSPGESSGVIRMKQLVRQLILLAFIGLLVPASVALGSRNKKLRGSGQGERETGEVESPAVGICVAHSDQLVTSHQRSRLTAAMRNSP